MIAESPWKLDCPAVPLCLRHFRWYTWDEWDESLPGSGLLPFLPPRVLLLYQDGDIDSEWQQEEGFAAGEAMPMTEEVERVVQSRCR